MTYLLDSPNLGGAETTILQLLDELVDIQPTVVAAAPACPRFVDRASVRAPVLVTDPVGQRWSRVDELAALLRRTEPALVHVNLVDPSSNRVLLAAAAAAGTATVATCHMTGPLGPAAARGRLTALYRRLHAVIAVSAEIAADLQRLGIDPGRVALVRNGVSRTPQAARPAGGSIGTVRIGAVGRLTAQKGFDLLLEATARLCATGRRVDVVIAGEGRDRAVLESRAWGLPVALPGYVADVPALLRSLDVFCLPSRAEGLPLALLEAMMAGLPCIATDVGDIRRAVADAATIIPPADAKALTEALASLVDDPARRRGLGRRARITALRRFDVRDTARTVRDVYAAARSRFRATDAPASLR